MYKTSTKHVQSRYFCSKSFFGPLFLVFLVAVVGVVAQLHEVSTGILKYNFRK